MTLEQRLLGLSLYGWSHVVLLTLQQENSDFPELNNKVLGMELFIVLLKSQASSYKFHRDIPDIDLIYRQDFLFETIT